MRLLHIVTVAVLLSVGSLSQATCYKPAPPPSKSGYGAYMNETFNYLECMHKEMVLDPLESGRARGNQHFENKQRYESMKEEVLADMESVRRTLDSGGTPAGGGGNLGGGSMGGGGPLSGRNCSELQRQAESRMQQLQSRLQNAGLCESYRISEELGQIGVQIYSQCRILDPNGSNLANAQQMVRDGRQGQTQACTR